MLVDLVLWLLGQVLSLWWLLLIFLAWEYWVYTQETHPRRIGQPAYAQRRKLDSSAKDKETEKGKEKEKDKDEGEVDVVIIGGGASGLAVGATLDAKGISYVILEGSGHVGQSWRKRYDRLHLHTCRDYSSLPFVPFPSSMPLFPSRDQVVQYLEGYAKMLKLNIRFHHWVDSAVYSPHDKRWTVQVSVKHKGQSNDTNSDAHTKKEYHPRIVVVASGEHTVPNIPQWETQSLFRGTITHSSQYKNGAKYQGRKVLVVGFGNSGGEIAVDLWEYEAEVAVLVRSPINLIPRNLVYLFEWLDLKGGARLLPIWMHDWVSSLMVKLYAGDLRGLGLTVPHPTLGLVSALAKRHIPPFIDIGTIDLIKQGKIKVCNKPIKGFTEESVIFEDDKEEPFDDVILATGYKFTSSFAHYLEPDVHKRVLTEFNVPESGKESPQEGLYFIGFNDLFGRLREINLEAFKIAELIYSKLN
jgi:indole-3-pyruvate monooxygenase